MEKSLESNLWRLNVKTSLVPIIKSLNEELSRFRNQKRITKTDITETLETLISSLNNHQTFELQNQDEEIMVNEYKYGKVGYKPKSEVV